MTHNRDLPDRMNLPFVGLVSFAGQQAQEGWRGPM